MSGCFSFYLVIKVIIVEDLLVQIFKMRISFQW